MTEAEVPSAIPPRVRRKPATAAQVTGCLMLLGGVGILLASRTESPAEVLAPGTVVTGAPQPPMLPPGYWEQTRSTSLTNPKEIVGPPVPASLVAAGKPFPAATGAGAGRIGFMGAIQGPLNAAVPEGGPVLGPGWERNPLPNVLAGPPIPPGLMGATPPPAAVASANPTSSELPDEKTVALSRLANPQVQVRAAAPTKAEAATAENPLTVHVALKDDDFRSGEPVTARVSANIACYTALVLVDSEGKSSTVFQSTRPTREFTCLLKAGPAPGTEYLLAVASLQPLGSVELAPAVRGAASGFAPARVTSAAGHAPPAAWTLAVAHVDTLDGDAKKLQRFEWNTGTATFVTLAPVVTASKPKPKSAAAPKDDLPQPAPDESTLPKPAPADLKPADKPVAPNSNDSVLPK